MTKYNLIVKKESNFFLWMMDKKGMVDGYFLALYFYDYVSDLKINGILNFEDDIDFLSLDSINSLYGKFDSKKNLNLILSGNLNKRPPYSIFAKSVHDSYRLKPLNTIYNYNVDFGMLFRYYVRYRNFIRVESKSTVKYQNVLILDTYQQVSEIVQVEHNLLEFSQIQLKNMMLVDNTAFINQYDKVFLIDSVKKVLLYGYIHLVEELNVRIKIIHERELCRSHIGRIRRMIRSKYNHSAIDLKESENLKEVLDILFQKNKFQLKVEEIDTYIRAENPYFYHFTDIDNFKNVLNQGGIYSRKYLNRSLSPDILVKNIASKDILNRRDAIQVTSNPKTVITDYVPFYFTKKSSMYYGLAYEGKINQKKMIYIAVDIERIREDGVVFSSAAANTKISPKFYYNPKDLVNLNWEIINAPLYKVNEGVESDVEKDLRKQKRMAEVLVKDFLPVDWIERIYVCGSEAFRDISQLLDVSHCDKIKIIDLKAEKRKHDDFYAWNLLED